MDPILAGKIIALAIRYAPKAIERLRKLFPGNLQALIDHIGSVTTPEEVEAMVLAGKLDDTWTECKAWLDGEQTAAGLLYDLICVQNLLKAGSIPDNEVKAADDAKAAVGSAHVAALKAMKAGDEPGYEREAKRMSDALATLGRIKAQYCPFMKKPK